MKRTAFLFIKNIKPVMKKIDGVPKSVRELFTGAKYSIHYYQREYQWQTKQIEELIDDLTDEFFEFYSEEDDRGRVIDYGHYFMGPIVLTADENAIIDGQQRLTSLNLLLIYLYHNIKDVEESAEVLQLIYSKKAGSKTFNIHVPEVPERHTIMTALLKKEEVDISIMPESIRNIVGRYNDIESIVKNLLSDSSLPTFKDWLLDNVDFIKIVAQTEQDAHKIFVSMNDRGLSLTPTEMLKGFLLSKIDNDKTREQANELWKSRILQLKGIGKEGESDFIKNWLRAQYADTIRERKKNALPGDYDIIGTSFHKWVREHTEELGLYKSKDYECFVLQEFDKFSRLYLEIKSVSTDLTAGYEHVYYNAERNFTLQEQLILSSISPMESKEVSLAKIKLVAAFMDLYFTRRIFNYKTVDYSSMVYNIFLLSKKLRGKTYHDLLNLLKLELEIGEFKLDTVGDFRLTGWTKRYMLHIIARMTDFIEVNSGLASKFVNYVDRNCRNPYDIEHIFSDHHEMFKNDFPEKETFEMARNKFGALLILPMDKNRSLSDLPYEKKLPIYFGENLLTKSLSEDCYRNNPQFVRFYESHSLHFLPIREFDKSSLQNRQKLYQELVSEVWSASVLDKVAQLKST